MRLVRNAFLLLSVGLSVLAHAANPLMLNLRPVPLSNGWVISGTITTDGTVGILTAANIIDWNLQVTQTTDMVWTEKDSNALNISGVSSDGKYLSVLTFPNGFQDGGTLFVGRGGGGGGIATNAIVADFTQLSVNLGYVGGMAGWQDELLGLNFVGLNRPNHSNYKAALADPNLPNVFNIRVPQIYPPPFKVTMFGSLTTDGTVGSISPGNLIAWKITARMQQIDTYTPSTTQVMAANGVSFDGAKILVDRAGGQLQIGVPGARPTYVTLADFTDPTRPNGFANYYVGNYGVMGEKVRLIGNGVQFHVVTK
jgi:hypothetical protein